MKTLNKILTGAKNILRKPITYAALIALPFLYSNNASAQTSPAPAPSSKCLDMYPKTNGWCMDTTIGSCPTGWESGQCIGEPYKSCQNYKKIKHCDVTPISKADAEKAKADARAKEIADSLANAQKMQSQLRTGQSFRDGYEYDFFINQGTATIKGIGWHNNDYLVDVEFEKGERKLKLYPNTIDTAAYAPDYSLSIDNEGKAKIQNFTPNAVYTFVKLDKETAKLARDAQSPLGINAEKAVKKKIGNDVYFVTETNFSDLVRKIEQSRIHYLDENGKEKVDTFYVFYADTLNQLKDDIQKGQALPLVFGEKTLGTDAFSYDREGNIYFTGNLYKAEFTSDNLLSVMDSLGENSMFFDSSYLKKNDAYLRNITKKEGTQGHVLELLDAEIEKEKASKEKKYFPLRLKVGAEYTLPEGFVFSATPQIVFDNFAIGPEVKYFSGLEKITESVGEEPGFSQLLDLITQKYFVDEGKTITEKTNVSYSGFALGLNASYVTPKFEANLNVGTIPQKTEKITNSEGRSYRTIMGNIDPATIENYNETNSTETNKPIFEGSPVYAGFGIEYFPFNGALKNLSVSGNIGYVAGDSKETSVAYGSVGAKYTINRGK